MTCFASLECKYHHISFIPSVDCLNNLYYSEDHGLSFEASCPLNRWLSMKEKTYFQMPGRKTTRVWLVHSLAVLVGGCCGALTQDSQLDPCAKVVGSGWSQAGSRNECDELYVGENREWWRLWWSGTCIPPAKCGQMWALCCQIFSFFQKKEGICGVVFLRHNLNTIKYINPNDFLHMYTFYIRNHHPYKDMEHFHLSESSVVLLSKSVATPPSPKVTTDLYIHKWAMSDLELLMINILQYVFFWVWLLLISIMFLRFVHVVLCISSSFFNVWVLFHCRYMLQFVYLLSCWWTFGSFPI